MAKSLDYWREYFRSANSDIFDIIEHAVMVAAFDCPKEFKLRRDHVAELLYTCKPMQCFGCESIELAVPKPNSDDNNDDEEEEEDNHIKCKNGESNETGGSKESKANSNRDNDHQEVEMDVKLNQVSNYSYNDAEALTDEMEEQSQLIGEVLRIKKILDHYQDQSDSILFESLRRLQLTGLSVEILKGTEIGKSVNALKKHGSKQIRDLVRVLVEGWVTMVDEWVSATAAITEEKTPESVKTSEIDEEEGLPSPPLDEGFLFATDTTNIEWSEFFEGMDDDGNPQNNGELNKNQGNGRNPKKPNNSIKVEEPEKKMKKTAPITKLNKPNKPPMVNNSRPTKPSNEQKVKVENTLQKKPLTARENVKNREREQVLPVRRKPLISQHDRVKGSDEGSIQVKLEAAKRKLQERYQEAENAKRRRTIQVMELHDIPKQGMGRNTNMKQDNRQRANNRR